jgi:hypothetical protein
MDATPTGLLGRGTGHALPTEILTHIMDHPEAGTPLYLGETPEREDVLYGVRRGSPSTSEVYTLEKIDVRVNLYGGNVGADWGVMEYRFPFYDSSLDPEQVRRLHSIADLAVVEWASGNRVAVNCQAGLNRSSLIMALMLRKVGMTSAEAITLMREKRSHYVLCNDHFEAYLLGLDAV